ncbi:uncharacterized protein [Primulina eburnea]|uniref:uncharacterized protein isoform X3 n=1 Tax=Primulina eburnea TaxID=1245227 RepID=UPI003C6C89C1
MKQRACMHECVMGEVPVDFEVEVERENGDGKGSVEESGTSEGVNGISRDDLGSSTTESVDRNLLGENFKFMEQSPEGMLDPTSSQLTAIEKINHSRGVLPIKILNENFPPKKKLKPVKRIATIQDDGTVQFDVGENIKPQCSNSGTEVIYDGHVIKEIVITEDTELLENAYRTMVTG